MAEEVSILEYKPEWFQQFKQERERLNIVFDDKAIAIEHIGSTSIIGLPSKPIIDIAVGIVDLSETDSLIEPLESIGYEYVPKADFPKRRFFRKGAWRKGTHHLHVYEISSDEWNNNLLFRDYLRNHPEKMLEYAKLKKHHASLYAADRATYTQMKAPFIRRIIELSKAED
ncbi:GrpB family protein [Paenibacillus tarimensis]